MLYGDVWWFPVFRWSFFYSCFCFWVPWIHVLGRPTGSSFFALRGIRAFQLYTRGWRRWRNGLAASLGGEVLLWIFLSQQRILICASTQKGAQYSLHEECFEKAVWLVKRSIPFFVVFKVQVKPKMFFSCVHTSDNTVGWRFLLGAAQVALSFCIAALYYVPRPEEVVFGRWTHKEFLCSSLEKGGAK